MKANYIEIDVAFEPKQNLCGYTVVGDISGQAERQLILKRPEKAERKPRKSTSRAAKPEAQAVV